MREGGREDVSPDVHVTSNVELRNNVRFIYLFIYYLLKPPLPKNKIQYNVHT